MPDALPEPARDLDGEGPIWQQIRRAIARPILNGDWAPGSRVPSEFDLMERYGAARMTVHRAIRSLATDGLVERRRKAGTIVATRPPERPVFEIWNIAAEVARRGGVYRFEMLEQVQLARGDVRRGPIGVDDRTPLLWIVCRHFSDGQVLQLEERLINLAASPEAAAQDFDRVSPGVWLLHNVAWTEAEHAITAEGAPEAVAIRLETTRDAACLVVERRTWNGGEPVTYVRLWHPGDRHRLVGRFKPVQA